MRDFGVAIYARLPKNLTNLPQKWPRSLAALSLRLLRMTVWHLDQLLRLLFSRAKGLRHVDAKRKWLEPSLQPEFTVV